MSPRSASSVAASGAPSTEAREPVPVHRTARDLARSGRLTPMLRQFLEVKQAHEDCLVMFRLGDFYECFFEDAVAASEILDLTLTARGKGEDRFPMAGIPHHAARGYLGRLVEAGRKVAIVDQMEDPAEAKGIVRREVTRILTPGMVLDDESLDPRAERLLATLVLGPERGGALAFLEVSTGALRVAVLEDDRGLGDELARQGPRELLVSESGDPERLAGVTRRLPDAVVWREDPDLFSPREGRVVLQRHLGAATLEGYGLPSGAAGAPLAGAAGAALRYAVRTQRQDAVHVDRLKVYRPGEHLILDPASRDNLEVLRTLHDHRRKGSLLGLMDRTTTAMGGRLLATWLGAPLRDLAPIRARQAAVARLAASAVLRGGVRERLKAVGDLERLLGRLALGQGTARDLKGLEHSLEALPALAEEVAAGAEDTPLLLESLAGFDGFRTLAARLGEALVEEPPATVTEGGMFRPGVSAELDEVLALAGQGKDWLLRFEQQERARTGISTLKIRFNRVFGYYIEITRAHLSRVPDDYERRQTMKGAERFVTAELKRQEEKVLSAEERRKALERSLFEALREEVVAQAGPLKDVAQKVATLDALASLAEVAAERGWVRPEMDESRDLEIEDGRHPVVEEALRVAQGEPYVPTDIRLDREAWLHVITGPNMAGKSTAMRMAALVALLAHVGSFVPARRARVGLCDRIFTRVGASDNLARGQSTFMVEMTETAAILHGATERSLVILDEIGRGTSTFDGVSIAWAVAEHIHDRVGCRTLFATHYHELTDLAKEKPGVANYTVAVKEWEGEVVFLRRLVAGAANRSYGIQVARLAGLPPEVLARAAEVLANLEAGELDALGHPALARRKGDTRPDSGQLGLFSAPAPRAPSEVERRLAEVDPDGLTPREAHALLYELTQLLKD